jgi:tRNA(fMet)-specific endonuclease VapC
VSWRVAYLLDTNICIQVMRGSANLAVSSITSYELYTGIEKCVDPAKERGKVELLLNTLDRVDFDLPAAKEAARIRADLE